MSEARILSLQEAEEWCEFDSPTRNKPVVQEYVQTWNPNRNVILEWIYPNEDFSTADIVGYGETNRLWTSMPTEEQRKQNPLH